MAENTIKKTELDLFSYLLLTLLALALFYLFKDTVYKTALICLNDDDYSHGTLLPLISGYLIWEKRAELKALFLEQTIIKPAMGLGLPMLLASTCFFILGGAADLLYLKWLAFFLGLCGSMFLVLGSKISFALLAPVVLNFMAKPIPDSLVPKLFFPLQVVAAKVSTFILDLLGVPVYLVGNIIEIPGMKLMVEEACSGLRSTMALITVAIIVIFSLPLKKLGKSVVLISSIVIAVVLNVFRVAITGILAHFVDPKAADGFFHSFSGMVVFIIGLFTLYYLGRKLSKKNV